jgi:fructose-bisphosphate aldolase, class I
MKLFRLNRLFNGKSKRCFDVAIDHGFFNELGFLSGIEDLERAVEVLVGAGPDAIQLTVGQAEVLQRIPNKAKPAGMTSALMAIVHEGATAEEANQFLSTKRNPS